MALQEPQKFIEVPKVDAKTAAVEMTGLRDVTAPPPVEYWPQTAGWYVLAVLLAALVAWAMWRRFRRWQALAYRRDALSALDRIAPRLADASARPAALREVAAIVKRTQLEELPRTSVAPLSGDAWRTQLESSEGGTLDDAASGLLVEVSSAKDAALANIPSDQIDSLVASVRLWLGGHHARVR
jgi:hypothetical protein